MAFRSVTRLALAALALVGGEAVAQNCGDTLIGTGIYIAAGSANEVLGNELSDVSTGVYVWPAHHDSRTGALRLDAFDNRIVGNRIDATHDGAVVGAGGRFAGGTAAANRLHENGFAAPVGIWFSVNAKSNDGRGNAYSSAAIPVVDHGSRNLWP